jgi:hypothetical protein
MERNYLLPEWRFRTEKTPANNFRFLPKQGLVFLLFFLVGKSGCIYAYRRLRWLCAWALAVVCVDALCVSRMDLLLHSEGQN